MNNIKIGNTQEAAELLGCHPGSLNRYRRSGEWLEGAHFWKRNSRVIRYNLTLIRDWDMNRSDPAKHLLAVQKFVQKRNSKT